jgi:hypothetical protein
LKKHLDDALKNSDLIPGRKIQKMKDDLARLDKQIESREKKNKAA